MTDGTHVGKEPSFDHFYIDKRSCLIRGRVQSTLIEKIKSLRGHTFSFYLFSGKFDRILNGGSSGALLQSNCRDRHSCFVHRESASLGVGQSFRDQLADLDIVNIENSFVGFVASEGVFRPNDKISIHIDITHTRDCVIREFGMKHKKVLCLSGCRTDFFTFISDHVNESVSYRFCSYVQVFFSCISCRHSHHLYTRFWNPVGRLAPILIVNERVEYLKGFLCFFNDHIICEGRTFCSHTSNQSFFFCKPFFDFVFHVFQLLNTVYAVQLYKLYGIHRTKTDVVI